MTIKTTERSTQGLEIDVARKDRSADPAEIQQADIHKHGGYVRFVPRTEVVMRSTRFQFLHKPLGVQSLTNVVAGLVES
jgi:hypothetical protein